MNIARLNPYVVFHNFALVLTALLAIALPCTAQAGVLPEDRADVLYHSYEGGGLKVTGPAVLIRKKIGESVGLSLSGDLDMVSSASIDVESAASAYKEERKQWSPTVSYLHGKTTYSASFLRSDEKDYLSDNMSFSVSEDMFGDLTTVTLGYSRGWDHVWQRNKGAGADGSDIYADIGTLDTRSYRIGLTQILTRKLIMTLNFESGASEGYLANPYRRVRYGEENSPAIQYQEEVFPETRATNALGIDLNYYLPYRASLKAGYRYYTDTWGINGHTGELQYAQPFAFSPSSELMMEVGVRYYTQNGADFYSDLFPYLDAQNFMTRDRQLSTMSNISFHIGGDWKLKTASQRLSHKFSLYFDRYQYSYQDFRNNLDDTLAPENQPLYSYGANVFNAQYSLGF